MGLFYFLLSKLIYTILAPFGIIFGLITNWKGTNQKMIHLAESTDRRGNVLCAELFNKVLITRDSVDPFGDGQETVSSAIGRNV
jgi:hypothetical protein